MAVKWIACAVLGYLLGSISASIIISKGRYFIDIRRQGSGNAGATNMARVHGFSAGLATLAIDMAKTAVAGGLGYLLLSVPGLMVSCALCLIGHCFPVYYSFRGGKGISVCGCIALLLDWRMFLILIAVFLIVALLSRRVSLASVVCAVVYAPLYYLLGHHDRLGLILCICEAALVLFQHRGNILRLIKGTEEPFRFRKGRER